MLHENPLLCLDGLRVLVSGSSAQGEKLAEHITKSGGQPILFPTINFVSLLNDSAHLEEIKSLGEQEILIFLSPRAVDTSKPLWKTYSPHFPDKIKIAAIGRGTALTLKQAGLPAALCPQEWNSEGLLAMPELHSIKGKKIGIIRGEGGRKLLAETLVKGGARVKQFVSYRRTLPASTHTTLLLKQLKQGTIDIVICLSNEGLKNLIEIIGPEGYSYLKKLPLLVISERIKAYAEKLGFEKQLLIARNAQAESILLALHDYKRDNTTP